MVYYESGDNMNYEKKTVRDEKQKIAIINRINRVNGQLGGIKKMIIEDRYCDDILTQLSAVEQAVKSISNQILEIHLRTCVNRNIKNENFEIIDELIDIFKRFNK